MGRGKEVMTKGCGITVIIWCRLELVRKTNRRTEGNGIVLRGLETGEGEEELHNKSKLFSWFKRILSEI